ncbi:MAG: DUF4214 domain-containing protein [Pyrinomonadaceae bacterium]
MKQKISPRRFPAARRVLRFLSPFLLSLSLLVTGSLLLTTATVEAQPRKLSKREQRTLQVRNRRLARRNRKRTPKGAVLQARRKSKTFERTLDAPATGEAEDGDEREIIDARQRWFMFRRAYPFDTPPTEGRRKAWLARPKDAERGGRKGVSSSSAAAMQMWRSIGPSPTTAAFPDNWGATSGRINAIAVHPTNPQIVLIGAATGGIWRSIDGGANFVPVSDKHVDLAVGSIAFSRSNPAIVYAGMGDLGNGYFGTGILKSFDAGATWARVSNDSLPPLGTTAKLEVDPANANRVYVLQATYTLTTPSDPNAEFRLVRNGFFLSDDGGVSWRRTLAGRPRDLAIHPGNPNILYLGMNLVDTFNGIAAGPAAVYKSANGGSTWEPVPVFVAPAGTNTRDVRVAVSPARPDALYVFSGSSTSLNLSVSSNAGLPGTWSAGSVARVDPAQFGYNSYIYIDPANADHIYLGTRDVYKSSDGGGTWTNLTKNFSYRASSNTYPYSPHSSTSHPDQHALAFDPANSNVIYIGNDGGLSKSTDGGATFVSQNGSFTLSQFVGITMHPIDPNLSFGGTQDNGTQYRLPGGNRWEEFAEGDGGQSVINPLDPRSVFTTYIFGRIRRWLFNADGTRTEQPGSTSNSTFGEPATGQRIAFYAPFKNNGVDATVYFGTWRLFVSANFADAVNVTQPTWTAPGGTTDLTKAVFAAPSCNFSLPLSQQPPQCSDVLTAIGVERRAGAQVLYTGSAQGRVMVTQDGGANWTDMTAGLPNRFVESLTVDPANAATAYVTFSGYGTGHLYRTTNFGQSWTDIGGAPALANSIPNVPISAFFIDPVNSSTLYAGSDIGVFRSTDNGATWETFNQGMLPAVVTGFATNRNNTIQLSTYGRGAYELTNAATACSYSVNSDGAQTFPASGGPGSFNIVTGANCSWRATSLVPWITITNGSGIGNGVITFNVAANSGQTRTGQILHTDDSFYTIQQAAAASPATVQFGASSYQSDEGGSRAVINITRTGDTVGAISVNVATVDDPAAVPCSLANQTAYARCDYATTIETLTFAPGETTRTIAIPLIDDTYVEGNETLGVKLSDAVGAALGGISTASLIIIDNDTAAAGANPITGSKFFVRQQYLDFLSREPEAGEPWTNVLNNCSDVNNNPACDRLTVSAAFFGSTEFQLKGFFVYRFYSLSFGRDRLPRYTEIVLDMRGVTGATPAEVYHKRAQFAQNWVQRPDFSNAYGQMSPVVFVNTLMERYGLQRITAPEPASPDGAAKVVLTRADLSSRLAEGALTRGQVVRAIVESDEVFAAEYQRAFVAMQYFGYLRRDPDAAGYRAWLNYLTANPQDARTMVRGFANSQEYQLRFGRVQ